LVSAEDEGGWVEIGDRQSIRQELMIQLTNL
jgi:hypothetical protein